jgi:hypothetical protein
MTTEQKQPPGSNLTIEDVQLYLGEQTLSIKLLQRENATLREEIRRLQDALSHMDGRK